MRSIVLPLPHTGDRQDLAKRLMPMLGQSSERDELQEQGPNRADRRHDPRCHAENGRCCTGSGFGPSASKTRPDRIAWG